MIAGTRLGPYEILALLGVGGMGEVWRARDTRLGRDVAVKVLPQDFVADADRLRRFEQEARTLATINHPNILAIFDTGTHGGAPYLVSEILEGHTLREVMRAGPLSSRKAIDHAQQIAQGLAAAHGKNIVHRDLKPENVFVTRDGRVKILDFGLAKLRTQDLKASVQNSKPPANSSTQTVLLDQTDSGAVMGTPSYMAPEQARGDSVDQRADLFAFGCVLYEMLSGQRPFKRDTAIATMAAIMNDEPLDLSVIQPDLPLALSPIVRRCLEKQPERRFQSASDLAFALESIHDYPAVASQRCPLRSSKPPRKAAGGLVGPATDTSH